MPHACPIARRDYLKKWRAAHADSIRIEKKQYRQANRERIDAKEKADYLANIEYRRARQRAYYRKNHVAIKKAHRAEYVKDPSKAKRISRNWLVNNRGKHRALCSKRRALKLNAMVGDRVAYASFVESVRCADRIHCYWCNKVVPKELRQIDHIVSLSRGGADDVHNLCCSRRSCNLSKGTKLPEEFSGQFVLAFA